MCLSSLVLLPSPDTTEVITIITQKRKGRSSICKTIFHLHICMTYFCFIKYKTLSNWKLLFQLSFITFSTFTTISYIPMVNSKCYIPIEKRVPQNAQKAPPQSFIPAVGLLYYLVFLSSSFFLPAFQRVRSGILQRASARYRRDLR